MDGNRLKEFKEKGAEKYLGLLQPADGNPPRDFKQNHEEFLEF